MQKRKTVMVTGANGLLGCNTILELLSQGFYVKGLLRDKRKFVGIFHENLELIEGDILNKKSLNNALRNCDYVIHTAAITSQSFLKYDRYNEVNVEGTKNVIQAAIRNQVLKVLYVGTANMFGSANKIGNETCEMGYPFDKTFYARSKKEGQEKALLNKDKIEILIVNPTFMIGAYDSKPSSGKIVLMGLNNRVVLCPPGGKSFVNVKDVSNAIIRVLSEGASGESYLLANENMSYLQFYKRLRKKINKKFLIVSIPKEILLLTGYLGCLLRFLKIRTPFSIENMKILCMDNYYSNDKVKKELKIKFNPIEEGIKEAVDWFNKNK